MVYNQRQSSVRAEKTSSLSGRTRQDCRSTEKALGEGEESL
jgi:hypothetical protein